MVFPNRFSPISFLSLWLVWELPFFLFLSFLFFSLLTAFYTCLYFPHFMNTSAPVCGSLAFYVNDTLGPGTSSAGTEPTISRSIYQCVWIPAHSPGTSCTPSIPHFRKLNFQLESFLLLLLLLLYVERTLQRETWKTCTFSVNLQGWHWKAFFGRFQTKKSTIFSCVPNGHRGQLLPDLSAEDWG